MTAAISASRVTKLYRRVAAGYQLRTLKSALLEGSLTAGLSPEESICALRDVSFEVSRGEAFGVIGGNGSGKSTLLKLVSGLLRPTSGRVLTSGRVAALIELGAGFHPEISGRENIYINGAVLGLSRRQVEQRYERIVEFSGLQDFIEEPVKNYSSGMYVRLGFAVAIHTEPDLLLVDEVLAVGDEAFAHRCIGRIEEHLARGGTLLVVSHSLELVSSLCNRALWLDAGRARLIGEPRRVIDAYREQVAIDEGRGHESEKRRGEKAGEPRAEAEGEEVLRWGSLQAAVVGTRLLVSATGRPEAEAYQLTSGSAVTFEIEAEAREPLSDFVFGVAIKTPRGIDCWGTNTDLAGLLPESFSGRARVLLHCPCLRLGPGEYAVDVAVHARDGTPYDYVRRCFRFTVSSQERGVGVYFPEHRWQATGDIRFRPQSSTGQPGRLQQPENQEA